MTAACARTIPVTSSVMVSVMVRAASVSVAYQRVVRSPASVVARSYPVTRNAVVQACPLRDPVRPGVPGHPEEGSVMIDVIAGVSMVPPVAEGLSWWRGQRATCR